MDINALVAISKLPEQLKHRARRGEIVFIYEDRLPGWSGSLPFYLFACVNLDCINHERLAIDYAHGFENHNKRVTCPDCGTSAYFPISFREVFVQMRNALISGFKQRKLLNAKK